MGRTARSIADIASLGTAVALLVIVAMAATIAAGFLLARALGQPPGYGALTGAATAVCGASATLATATVVPHYQGKEADVAFVVVAVNTLSTGAMLLYPLICRELAFDPQTSGGLLIAVPDADALTLLAELQKSGHREAAIVGRVTTRAGFPLELV